jgi:small subunit ribosomal protein S19
MARIYTYKGKTIEQLQAMQTDEFLKLIKSRERRSVKRMGIDYKQLVEKVDAVKKSGKAKVIKTRCREAVILPSWVNSSFAVHTGKEYKEFKITPEMLGHRLGEFAFSTKRVQHSAPGIRATRGSKFLAVK